MNDIPISPKSISPENPILEFSVCTMVTRLQEYQEMVDSFLAKGFNKDCEFLYVDNSTSNQLDGFQSLNLFLKKAKGRYIIVCHQDIILHKDGIKELRNEIEKLNRLDPNWAVLGNAGANGPNHIVYHISYPDGTFLSKGNFPEKVQSLDENFIVVKNSTQLQVSTDLKGYHLYATDLCMYAELNGYNCYVIPFNLIHKSRGNKNDAFYTSRAALIQKYNRFFRTRWVQTNSTVFHLSGSSVGRIFGNQLFLFFVRMYNGLKKRMH